MSQPQSETRTIADASANGVLRVALQGSEPRRIAVLLGVLVFDLLTNVFRHVTGGKIMQGETYVLRLVLLGAVAAYALALLRMVRRANARQELLPAWTWLASAVIEALYPSLAVLIVLLSGHTGPFEGLTAPALLLYPIMIVLSILRMRPALCAVSGVLCAVGHAGLFALAAHRSPTPPAPGDWPVLLSYPIYLAIAGAAAALVSFEVRKYFRSSLREAEARRRLDLVHKEVDIARAIQQGLLPENPPHLPGFDIAGWNRPADRTGGDYYDWQVLPDGRLAVVIADVSGHGLGPALIMAVCRAYARACVPIGPELCAAVGRINTLLHNDVHDGRFVTFAVAIVDPASGSCELLSAGHGPILLHRARQRTIEEFNGNGVPLGVLENEDYGAPQRIQLEPGDALVLVTDGFFEWARPADGELFGIQRMRECLLSETAVSAATIIERLDEAVRTFGGDSAQADDMTAVVIRRIADAR